MSILLRFLMYYLATAAIMGFAASWYAGITGRDRVRWFFYGLAMHVAVIFVLYGVQKKRPDALR